MKKYLIFASGFTAVIILSAISFYLGRLSASFELNDYYSKKVLTLEVIVYDRLQAGDCAGMTSDLKQAIDQTYSSYERKMELDPILILLSGNEKPGTRFHRSLKR